MRRIATVVALLCGLFVLASPFGAGATPIAWSGSGPGIATVVSDGTASDPLFTYDLNPAGFSTVSWDFTTVAAHTGPVTLQYDYSGLHAWYQVTVFLDATVNGLPVATLVNDGPADCCTPPSNGFSYTGSVTLNVTAGDTYGFRFGGRNFDYNNFLMGTLKVHIVNAAPDCSAAAPSESTLWPPDHRMVDITVGGVTDADGDAITTTITSIWQDEPTNGLGDGDTSPDGAGVGTGTGSVRAERSGTGDGRFYHIAFTAEDGRGGSCTGQFTVDVAKSQGKKGAAVDGGALYDSTLP